jgi:hypothetical protein
VVEEDNNLDPAVVAVVIVENEEGGGGVVLANAPRDLCKEPVSDASVMARDWLWGYSCGASKSDGAVAGLNEDNCRRSGKSLRWGCMQADFPYLSSSFKPNGPEQD